MAYTGPVPAPPAGPENPFGRKYQPRIYTTERLITTPPVIDGRLDDEAWRAQGEWAGSYTQQMPIEGARPTEATELKILYDDRHLYFAIRAYDDPAKIHRYPGRRDDFGEYATDVVGICFDSYNDKRTGFEFDLTAGGGKIDLILGNGETEWDTTWDAVWDGKVAHDEKGWTAEFRVPLNQLRFGKQKEQVWGMHAWRWLARNTEESQWQLIPRQNTGRMYQLGELHGIRDLPPARHVELLPHVVGKTASGPSFPGEGTDGSGTVGLDAKVGLTTNFTLDATVNPDFGQVEADPSVLNLSAYETFYEEKRPFFLEGRKILKYDVEDEDQLFYSRRIGQPPSLAPEAPEGATVRVPESTTILGALKVTGKTNDGLSVAVLQAFTQKESADVSWAGGSESPVVEPFGSYTAGRVQKDWNKGNTILGGMITSTHRSISDPSLAFLPSQAWSGGADFIQYFDDRFWVLDAKVVGSRVEGDREAIQALQTSPVHYYQRPDATHLGVDESATSLAGHGGSVRFGTSGKGRFRATSHFHWYSPGLELNDVGYLRQADVKANQVFLGWAESRPKGIFREYSFQGSREDQWDFGGLHTKATTAATAEAAFQNKWRRRRRLLQPARRHPRPLRRAGAAVERLLDDVGGREHGQGPARVGGAAGRPRLDPRGRHDEHDVALEGLFRPSGRLTFSATGEYLRLEDDLQYVGTVETTDGTRWMLGRNNERPLELHLPREPRDHPRPHAHVLRQPVHRLEPLHEHPQGDGHARRPCTRAASTATARTRSRTRRPATSTGSTRRAGRASCCRTPTSASASSGSNLVARWEWKPGSALYVVWQQGRCDYEPYWSDSFHSNWRALWSTPRDSVFHGEAQLPGSRRSAAGAGGTSCRTRR